MSLGIERVLTFNLCPLWSERDPVFGFSLDIVSPEEIRESALLDVEHIAKVSDMAWYLRGGGCDTLGLETVHSLAQLVHLLLEDGVGDTTSTGGTTVGSSGIGCRDGLLTITIVSSLTLSPLHYPT